MMKHTEIRQKIQKDTHIHYTQSLLLKALAQIYKHAAPLTGVAVVPYKLTDTIRYKCRY